MNWKKKITAVLLSAAVCGTGGCSTASSAGSSAAEENGDSAAQVLTFTDDLGREVTVESTSRTAILLGSYADIWCLAGGKDTICAAAKDTWTDFDLDLDENVISTGSMLEPDLEALISAEPDLIIASSYTSAQVDLQSSLEEISVPVAYFGVNNFDEYLHMLEICTQITGCTENYQTYGLDVQEEINQAKEMIDGSQPTVLMIRAGGKGCTVKNSEGTVLGEMLADLDTVNIADSDTSLLENLSMEQILAEDPDYIFAVYQGSDTEAAEASLQDTLLSNPAWASLKAVQNNHYYVMDRALYHLKPNAQWGKAYQQLAEILYDAES